MDLDLTVRAFQRRRIANPIEAARDGQEALEWIERWDAGAMTPALILLHLKLPKIDGMEVLLHLKRHPTYRTIPVVVLTTSAADRDVQTAYRNGANLSIVKPVNFEKFVEVAAQIDLYRPVLERLEPTARLTARIH